MGLLPYLRTRMHHLHVGVARCHSPDASHCVDCFAPILKLKLPSYNSASRALALHMRKLKLSSIKYKRTSRLYSGCPELRLRFLLPPLGANAARFLTLGLSDAEGVFQAFPRSQFSLLR